MQKGKKAVLEVGWIKILSNQPNFQTSKRMSEGTMKGSIQDSEYIAFS
jgi:hypothetical protein